MRAQLIRRMFILLAALLLVGGFSMLLNRISYDPDFSVVDAITSPTKRSRKKASGTETVTAWGYTAEDLALPEETLYTEETVETESGSFIVLQKTDLTGEALVLLSDKNSSDYAEAVQAVADWYEAQGYTVEIRAYSETMLLSLAHAGHFDLFLLREEAVA